MWSRLVLWFSLLSPLFTPINPVPRAMGSLVYLSGWTAVEGSVQLQSYTCSGFVVAPQRVLTAAHCVGTEMLADGVPVTAVLKVDGGVNDLALLSVPTAKPALTFRLDPLHVNDILTGIGYGWGWHQAMTMHERVMFIDYSPFEAFAPGVFMQGEGVGGMSGGPVVDAEGRVAVILQQDDHGVCYGVGTLLMRAFLLGT